MKIAFKNLFQTIRQCFTANPGDSHPSNSEIAPCTTLNHFSPRTLNYGSITPPEHFLSSLIDLDSKKRALTTHPEVFDWYPDLGELAKRMLAYGNIDNLSRALQHGRIAPVQDRDEFEYLKELETTNLTHANILRTLLGPATVRNKLLDFISELGKSNPDTAQLITSAINSSGYEAVLNSPLDFLPSTEPEVVKTLKTFGEELTKAREIRDSLFSYSEYRQHFNLDRVLDYRLDALLGEVFKYTPEDILVFGFIKYLPEGIHPDNHEFKPFKDPNKISWDFVSAFFNNAKQWEKLTNQE